jgi:hypothetical protein
MSTLKKPKTSKTKIADDMLNAGSGKTIKQPNVNDDKLTSITEMRQSTHGESTMALEDEQRLRKAFVDKDWNEIKIADSWQIFKVMAEFVEGFEKMSKIGPCVSIFGSARTKPENPYYQMAEEIAAKLVRHGYGVITGGGPGIMEAGNKGARRGRQVGGPQHRTALRANAQHLHRPGQVHQLRLLLRAQGDVCEVRAGFRGHARRLRHARRIV